MEYTQIKMNNFNITDNVITTIITSLLKTLERKDMKFFIPITSLLNNTLNNFTETGKMNDMYKVSNVISNIPELSNRSSTDLFNFGESISALYYAIAIFNIKQSNKTNNYVTLKFLDCYRNFLRVYGANNIDGVDDVIENFRSNYVNNSIIKESNIDTNDMVVKFIMDINRINYDTITESQFNKIMSDENISNVLTFIKNNF